MLTIAMSFFGLLGIAGIYTRQVKGAGWFGLAGFLLLSLWFVLVTGFTFFEAFVLPLLATDSPTFAASFLGIFTGAGGETSVGALATLWTLLGVVYILRTLLFGIGTFRAGILSRWAGALLGLGAVSSPAFALLPQSFAPCRRCRWGLVWRGWDTRSGPKGASQSRKVSLPGSAHSSAQPQPGKFRWNCMEWASGRQGRLSRSVSPAPAESYVTSEGPISDLDTYTPLSKKETTMPITVTKPGAAAVVRIGP